MKSLTSYNSILFMGLLLFTVSILLTDIAQSQNYPPGNYRDTCENLVKIGHMLEGNCKKRDGTWQHSVIFFKSCKGPIHNNNGTLTCNHSGNNWVPPGSYQKSCTDINTKDGELWARCQMRDGQWRESSLDYRNCYQEITNENGRLTCGQRHHHHMLPRGSYKETCRDLGMNGDVLSAECQRRDGTWRFTSLDVGECYGEVVNQNGRLECR